MSGGPEQAERSRRARGAREGTQRTIDVAGSVLAVVDRIPPGKVMSYGDIAEWVGIRSARQVGRVMSRHGDEVPWHRVVMADGRPAPHHAREQLALLRADGTPLVVDGTRVDMRRARWDGAQ